MITITILSLIVAISLQNVKTKISPLTFSRITSIFFLYSAFLAFNVLHINSIGSGIGIYSGLYQVTSISQSIEIFIYLIGALVLMPWSPVPNSSILGNTTKTEITEYSVASPQYSPRLSEYSLIILFTTLGASLLISSSDLISMYLSIELQSFAVYLLATIYRDSESSTSAGLKYFLLGGLSSCFILLGSGLIYSFTGLSNLESITSLVSVTSSSNGLALFSSSATAESVTISQGYLLGLIIIVVGFLFKIAAAPFHNWAPDVYDEVPTIITTWLTVMPKISILIFLLELESDISLNIDYLASSLGQSVSFSSGSLIGLNGYSTTNIIKNLLLICSLLSLVIGTVLGLAQYKIKRLLAYSTVSHVGFLLLALAVNTEQSVESLIFYLIQYSITNLNVFLIILAFGYIIKNTNNKNTVESTFTNKMDSSYSDIRLISELKGQFYSSPLLGLSFAACLFSMAGIPPLMGFFAKQQVLYSASHSGYFFISIVAICVSVISAYYYLQIIRVIHFDSPSEESTNRKENENRVEVTNIHSMTISTLTLMIILFMINPSILLNSTHLMALSIFTS